MNELARIMVSSEMAEIKGMSPINMVNVWNQIISLSRTDGVFVCLSGVETSFIVETDILNEVSVRGYVQTALANAVLKIHNATLSA